MSYEYKAGEYKTSCGADAVVLEVGPDGNLYGRQYTGGSWYASTWSPDGSSRMFGGTCDFALMPPKRQVWVAVWLRSSSVIPKGVVESSVWASEAIAEKQFVICRRTRIAVLGPIDVEAEP